MHRFFVDAAPAERAFLAGDQARQIAMVLRLKPGEHVVLVADGTEHEVELQAVATAQVTGKVVERRAVTTELAFRVTLAIPVLKGDRSEEIVEATTQLGVSRFVPFIAERSVVRELTSAKRDRWAKIAREAAETSHRGVVPSIEAVMPWPALLQILDRPIVLWEEATEPHLLDAAATGDVALVVGPEGGLAADEVELARGRGATIASLGRRILRAETAAIAAVAMLTGSRERT